LIDGIKYQSVGQQVTVAASLKPTTVLMWIWEFKLNLFFLLLLNKNEPFMLPSLFKLAAFLNTECFSNVPFFSYFPLTMGLHKAQLGTLCLRGW